jgi:DNA-binding NarL/FixJ family response regulator
MTELNPMRILIADDHPMFRRGLKSLLSAQDDMEVIGEAASAAEAVQQAASLPDVVLMDLHMPGGGIEATREIVRLYPNVRGARGDDV